MMAPVLHVYLAKDAAMPDFACLQEEITVHVKFHEDRAVWIGRVPKWRGIGVDDSIDWQISDNGECGCP